MRSQVACSLLFTVVFVCWSSAEDKPAKKPDTEAIHGEWKIIYVEVVGEVTPPEVLKAKMVYIFADGKVTIKYEGKIVVEKKYKLDSSKQPKHIDLSREEKDEEHGIYELDGDKLSICVPAFGMKAERPRDFKAPKDSGLTLMKLERIKR